MIKAGLFFSVIAFAVIFISCAPIEGTIDEVRAKAGGPTVTLYTAGNYTEGGKQHAIYWKNSTPFPLADPSGSFYLATGGGNINVVNGTVYTGGHYTINLPDDYRAVYWKNNELKPLNLPSNNNGLSSVRGLVVKNNKVYVAGWYGRSGGDHHGIYWIDSVPTILNDNGAGWSYTTGLTVTGSKVYSTGNFGNGVLQKAIYWTDTVPTVLAHPPLGVKGSSGTSITVKNDTVYIAGYYVDGSDAPHAVLWTHTPATSSLTYLEEPSTYNATDVKAITVENGTVYIAGFYRLGSNLHAAYWKGAEMVPLTTPPGEVRSCAYSIDVVNGVVYVGGYYSDATNKKHPCYWKDGVINDFGPLNDNDNVAYSFMTFR